MSKCERCNRERKPKSLILIKGRFLCGTCKPHRMLGQPLKSYFSLERALKKIHTIKGYRTVNGRIVCTISVPQILIGHKVKLVLADE